MPPTRALGECALGHPGYECQRRNYNVPPGQMRRYARKVDDLRSSRSASAPEPREARTSAGAGFFVVGSRVVHRRATPYLDALERVLIGLARDEKCLVSGVTRPELSLRGSESPHTRSSYAHNPRIVLVNVHAYGVQTYP